MSRCRIGSRTAGSECVSAVRHRLDSELVLRGLARSRRHAADLGRLRAVRAGPARDRVGVAGDHRHLLERHAQPLSRDLRERGLVTLPVGEGPGLDDRVAVGRDLDRAEF